VRYASRIKPDADSEFNANTDSRTGVAAVAWLRIAGCGSRPETTEE
jgi:hypothetical protein